MAWVIWLTVHIFYLMGFRNRLLVMINWVYNYLFYERGVRIIVGLRRECEPALEQVGQRAVGGGGALQAERDE